MTEKDSKRYEICKRYLKRSRIYKECCEYFRKRGVATWGDFENFPAKFSKVKAAFFESGDVFIEDPEETRNQRRPFLPEMIPPDQDPVSDGVKLVLGLFDNIIEVEAGDRKLSDETLDFLDLLRKSLDRRLSRNPLYVLKAIDLRTPRRTVKIGIQKHKPKWGKRTTAKISNLEKYLAIYDAHKKYGGDWDSVIAEVGNEADKIALQDTRVETVKECSTMLGKARKLIKNAEKCDFPGDYY